VSSIEDKIFLILEKHYTRQHGTDYDVIMLDNFIVDIREALNPYTTVTPPPEGQIVL